MPHTPEHRKKEEEIRKKLSPSQVEERKKKQAEQAALPRSQAPVTTGTGRTQRPGVAAFPEGRTFVGLSPEDVELFKQQQGLEEAVPRGRLQAQERVKGVEEVFAPKPTEEVLPPVTEEPIQEQSFSQRLVQTLQGGGLEAEGAEIVAQGLLAATPAGAGARLASQTVKVGGKLFTIERTAAEIAQIQKIGLSKSNIAISKIKELGGKASKDLLKFLAVGVGFSVVGGAIKNAAGKVLNSPTDQINAIDQAVGLISEELPKLATGAQIQAFGDNSFIVAAQKLVDIRQELDDYEESYKRLEIKSLDAQANPEFLTPKFVRLRKQRETADIVEQMIRIAAANPQDPRLEQLALFLQS